MRHAQPLRMSEHAAGKPATKMFKRYAINLVIRSVIFLYALYLFIFHPDQLEFTENLGLPHGFTFVDFFFIVLVLDIVSKFLPMAPISMGSLKQYRRFHVPTSKTFEGGRRGLMEYVREAIDQGILQAKSIPESLQTAFEETRDGAVNAMRQLLRSVDVLRMLPFSDEQLSATEQLRSVIRQDRVREVVPVLIFWVVANALVMVALGYFGLLTPPVLLIWTLFYFVFDMFSVVLWCPLQVWFMKNRCCTTCQIFNWDAIMTVTPLLIMPCPFSLILIGLSLIVLVRWELAFLRHPERFDERTNASLQCANCKDRLCYLREPLVVVLPDAIAGIEIDQDGEVSSGKQDQL